jgi:nucleoside-diphosphate-sugar epimerase
MKRVAITGHTYGIGKSLFEHLSNQGVECKGFSRSNGYDINNPVSRKQILNESIDFDTFINCAYNGFGQTYMLIDFFNRWADLEKTIINIGSRVTEVNLPESRFDLLNYQAEKMSLKTMSEKLSGYTCKVKYKSFGYVGTERILERYPHFTEKDYITLDRAVDIILSD